MFTLIESNSLPYYREDGTVSVFDRHTGRKIIVKECDFEDVSTEGGGLVGLYKFKVKKEVSKDVDRVQFSRK